MAAILRLTRTRTRLKLLDEFPCMLPQCQLPLIKYVLKYYYYYYLEEAKINHNNQELNFNDALNAVTEQIINIWMRSLHVNTIMEKNNITNKLKKPLSNMIV